MRVKLALSSFGSSHVYVYSWALVILLEELSLLLVSLLIMDDEFIETEFDGDIPQDVMIQEETNTTEDKADVKLKNYI